MPSMLFFPQSVKPQLDKSVASKNSSRHLEFKEAGLCSRDDGATFVSHIDK